MRLVHGLSQLVRGLGELLAGRIHGCRVRAFQGLLGVRHCRLDLAFFIARDLVAIFLQHLLHLIDQAIKLVAGLDLLALGFVFRRMRFSFLGHALDFFLAQAGRRSDLDLLFLVRGLVFRGHVQNAVGVDIERHLNLGHATRGRR